MIDVTIGCNLVISGGDDGGGFFLAWGKFDKSFVTCAAFVVVVVVWLVFCCFSMWKSV